MIELTCLFFGLLFASLIEAWRNRSAIGAAWRDHRKRRSDRRFALKDAQARKTWERRIL
jgi:hypothetical protein